MRRPAFKSVFAWTILALFALSGLLWAIAIAFPFAWITESGYACGLRNSTLWCVTEPWEYTPTSGYYVAEPDYTTAWSFISPTGHNWYMDPQVAFQLRLWLLCPIMAAAVAAAWWRRILPVPPYLCKKCRYDLRGAPPTNGVITCSECGERAAQVES